MTDSTPIAGEFISGIVVKPSSEIPDDIGLLFQAGQLAGIVNIVSDQYHVFPNAEPDTLYGSEGFMALFKDKMKERVS